MYRSEDILTLDTLRDNDSILEVVTLPRHKRHLEVTTKSQLTLLGRVTLGKNLTLSNLLAGEYRWLEGYSGILVSTTVAWEVVNGNLWSERCDLLILGTLVANLDACSIGEHYLTLALSNNLNTAVDDHILLDTCTYDRSLRTNQWHCLAHHI